MRIKIPLATSDNINDNVLAGNVQERKPWARLIRGVSMTGSNAIGDAECAIYVEETEVARLVNTATGLAGDNLQTIVQAIPVPANALLRCLVLTAVNTSAGNVFLDCIP